MATIDDFTAIDIRVGKIIEAHDFPEARKPSYKLTIDFGPEIGIKHSCGQFVKHRTRGDLVGQLVLGVVNLREAILGIIRYNDVTYETVTVIHENTKGSA